MHSAKPESHKMFNTKKKKVNFLNEIFDIIRNLNIRRVFRVITTVLVARAHIFRVNGPGENENFSAVSVPCSSVSATGDERRCENVNTRFFFFIFVCGFFVLFFLVFLFSRSLPTTVRKQTIEYDCHDADRFVFPLFNPMSSPRSRLSSQWRRFVLVRLIETTTVYYRKSVIWL